MALPELSWPGDLRLSAAIRPLATALYVAHVRADGVAPKPFAKLDLHIRRFYEEIALTTLRGLTRPKRQPDYFQIAADAARIIGRITPSAPWGESDV